MPDLRGAAGGRLALASLLVALALLALHAPALGYPPIALDDYGSLAALRDAPLSALLARDRFGHFRPAKSAFLWAVAQSRDAELSMFRSLVLLAHAAAALLVARLFAQITSAPWVGLLAALAWSLHPATATVTAWLSAANLAFAALGALLYLHAARFTSLQRGRAWALGAGLSLGFAAAHHELALLAPALHALAPRRSSQARFPRPLALATVAVCVLYGALFITAKGALPGYRFAAEPRWRLMLHAPRYLLTNTSLWLWPFGRFEVLGRDDPSAHTTAAALAWLGLFAIALCARRVRESAPILAYASVWWLLFLAPVSNFVPFGNTPVAGHYGYLAGPGLALALLYSVGSLRLAHRRELFVAGASVLALWGCALAVESRTVLTAWSSEEALYRTTLANQPENVEAVANLSSLYLRRTDYERARQLLERQPQSVQKDPIVLINTLDLWLATGDANRVLTRLAAVDSGLDAELMLREARALQQLAQHARAAASFERAYRAARLREQRELRFAAGFQALVEHLASGDGGAAARLLRALTDQYPGREELRIATDLLHREAE